MLIGGGILQKYVDREGAGCFSNTAPSAPCRRLDEAGRDLLLFAVQFKNKQLRRSLDMHYRTSVLHEPFEIEQEVGDAAALAVAIPREPADLSCDGVSNPADPDASYNAHKSLGHMAEIVETYAEDDPVPGDSTKLAPDEGGPAHETAPRSPDLITHADGRGMTVQDGHRLPDALNVSADGSLTPKLLLADSHYGSADNMTLAGERGLDLTALTRSAKGSSSWRLTLEDFSLDHVGLVLKCPDGAAPVSTSAARAKLQARFDLVICKACRNRGAAQYRPTNMTASSPGFNTRQHARTTRNDGPGKAAMCSARPIGNEPGTTRRCHA